MIDAIWFHSISVSL